MFMSKSIFIGINILIMLIMYSNQLFIIYLRMHYKLIILITNKHNKINTLLDRQRIN